MSQRARKPASPTAPGAHGQTPAATPLDAPLAGGLVIEASAGTGKTYALTTVAARAVVEAALPMDRMLVVTFTVAAAGELRHRLRRTLTAAAAAVGGAGDDDQAVGLAERWQREGVPREVAEQRLAEAIRDLDRACVTTIHGFCQRLLTDFAFDGNTPFGFEVAGDDRPAVAAAVRDFWRRSLAAAPAPMLQHAAVSGFTLAELTPWVERRHAKAGLEIRGAGPGTEAIDDAATAWQRAFDRARSAWTADRDALSEAIGEPNSRAKTSSAPSGATGALKWRKRSEAKMQRHFGDLERAFATGDAGALSLADAGYFGAAQLERILIKGQRLPPLPLLQRFDELGAAAKGLEVQLDAWLRCQYLDLLDAVRRTLRDNAWRDRQLGFNALLAEAARALEGSDGAALAAQLRERFPLALIDEFQDTDALQADIFRRIYHASAGTDEAVGGLVTVGDPKQSIYAFRGADVFAYLRTSRAAGAATRLRLDTNHRSTPGLVRAVNALFAGRRPFLLPGVRFEAARARSAGSESPAAEADRPLQLRLLSVGEGEERLDKAQCEQRSAEDAAGEIATLLRRGGTELLGRPPTGGDIAVLVRTRAQGAAMARALRNLGVQSVQAEDASVFATAQAEQIEWLLDALAALDRGEAAAHEVGQRLRTALAGDAFGLDLAELAALVDDDAAWSAWQQRARQWAGIWRQGGVAALLRHLLFAPPVFGAATLLRAATGVRQLTNHLHLAELLQQAESAEHLSPAAVVEWLAARREAPAEEATQLRLESDEELVRIVTVHRSKGLEFPVVFCPFAWYRRRQPRRDAPTAEYHDDALPELPEVLDLQPDDAARQRQRVEDYAEELRLFYVAVTRARKRCVATWMLAPDAGEAPLAWLLHGRQRGDDPAVALKSTRQHLAQLAEPEWEAEVRRFAEDAEDIAVAVPETKEDGAVPLASVAAPPAPTARRFSRPLRPKRQMTSYSALLAEAGAATTAAEHVEVERADHDQRAEQQTADPDLDAQGREGFFAFPRGRRAGDCLHELFEHSGEPQAEFAERCERALARRGLDAGWAEVAGAMVANAQATPLAPASAGARGFRLAEVDRSVAEMEFHLPAAGLDRGRLGRCLAEAGYEDPFAGLDAGEDIHGFLHGYVDLVAEHGGRWYVVDYKSNWLGNDIDAYGRDAVAAAMRRGGYRLQYLLYLVALHRHLRLRLPGYDYETHIGGAYYLFVRGMGPERPGHAVWFDAPPRRCIAAIDACLAGTPTAGAGAATPP